MATTHVDGFVVSYTDWLKRTGLMKDQNSSRTALSIMKALLSTPSMVEAPYGDWAPFLYEDMLHAHTQLNGDDAVSLRLGDQQKTTAPALGTALQGLGWRHAFI